MRTDFAQAWKDCLPSSHRDALFSALCILYDQFFEDDLEDDNHVFREYLPRKYVNSYTPQFLKRFYVAFLTVGYKLSLPKKPGPLLSCTAEELALYLLIQEASAVLESQGIDPDFGLFEDAVFEDTDFLYLYQPEWDGIEDSEVGNNMGIVNLHFRDWFKPFRSTSVVHPLCEDEDEE